MTEEIIYKHKKVAVKSITSGRVFVVEAGIHVPPENRGRSNFFLISIAIILLTIGVFFPPILLLNIPILMLRYAYSLYCYIREHRVRLGFVCPACDKTVATLERSDKLPFMMECPFCKAQLEIEDAVYSVR